MQCTLYSSERDPAQDEKRPSIMTRSIRYRGSSPQHPYAVGHENSCPTAAASPPDITVVVLRLRGCCLFAALVISGFYWYTADGQILDAHQDKKGALAISPPIVLLAGKHGTKPGPLPPHHRPALSRVRDPTDPGQSGIIPFLCSLPIKSTYHHIHRKGACVLSVYF